MKNIKIILVFFTVFFGSIKANAQYQGTYLGFEVVGSSALMVNQNATSTTFNIKIFVSRFYGTGGYQPFYMNFKLGIENGAVFTNVYTITSSDFQTGQGNAEKQFSVTLQNSSLPHGKSLLIHYNNPSNSNPSYTASYNPKISIFNPPPATPVITNNVITLQGTPSFLDEISIQGSSPTGGTGSFAYNWQYADDLAFTTNVRYVDDYSTYVSYNLISPMPNRPIYVKQDNSLTVSFETNGFLSNSRYFRRVVTSGDKTSFSNVIRIGEINPVNFTVSVSRINLNEISVEITPETNNTNITYNIYSHVLPGYGEDPARFLYKYKSSTISHVINSPISFYQSFFPSGLEAGASGEGIIVVSSDGKYVYKSIGMF